MDQWNSKKLKKHFKKFIKKSKYTKNFLKKSKKF